MDVKKRPIETKDEEQSSSEQPAAPGQCFTASVIGIPSKRRKLGDAGWSEVTTTTGLKYYVNKATQATTWIRPPEVKIWQDRKTVAAHEREKAVKQEEASRLILEREDETSQWHDLMRAILLKRKIPPIIPFDRAEKRLLEDSRLQQIPKEHRQVTYEKVRQELLKTPTGEPSGDATSSSEALLDALRQRLETLVRNRKVRAEHTSADVWDLFLKDSRWFGLKGSAKAAALIQSQLVDCRTAEAAFLEENVPAVVALFEKFFEAFIKEKSPHSGEDLKEAPVSLSSLLLDNQFAVEFLDPSNMASYLEFLRDNMVLMDAGDKKLFQIFASRCPSDRLLDLISDAWQTLTQRIWQQHLQTTPSGP